MAQQSNLKSGTLQSGHQYWIEGLHAHLKLQFVKSVTFWSYKTVNLLRFIIKGNSLPICANESPAAGTQLGRKDMPL